MAIAKSTIRKWLNKYVELTNTNHFLGTKGKIISIENSTEEKAIYGYEIKIKLTCGLTVLAYKFEGLTIFNSHNKQLIKNNTQPSKNKNNPLNRIKL